ncbi:TonB-dependent receptor [Herminiimonas sp. KBW02]|uniref:TonB-dependent receptor n=1 Tax=Herminiimonas sp. KBW02 TaxID=2153363 RepID=UPI000F5AA170|nr:TonB-dependent receptor [Herminiimonas sp. KBW02]RQO34760.1 TonB-dependent receptor [Herminiimonas sp. KBW02]
MIAQRTLLASAVLSALASLSNSALAQEQEKVLPAVVVTASPFSNEESAQIMAPAKVLYGNELREKLGNSLGDTLSQELGVSASAFGAGASRPIIRGMEGPRVKILQNGMSVMDASSLSNDHAVVGESATARQIEILRGPAALLYGSGAIGGVVNIVNDRIPTILNSKPTGDAELRFGSADKMKNGSFSVDGAAGAIGLHVDGNARDADDYKIPGYANASDASQGSGRLPNSYVRSNSVGFGASYIQSWGYIGASVGADDNRYGIPTAEKSYITQKQTRYDVAGLIKNPFENFESFRFKLGYTDYKHTENLEDGTPATEFKNKANETRWELTHKPLAGWRGTFGLQTENSEFSALPVDDGHGHSHATVPVTKSQSVAAFLVEERDFGPFRASAGARIESVKRRPDAASGLVQRDFNLGSYSLGGLWSFTQGYGLGLTASVAQRAPAIEELYSNGPHESTATFDIGDSNLRKETSRNIELSLQKTEGLLRWKTNVYQNRVKNYVYGRTDGTMVDDHGDPDPSGEFLQRFWSQNDATIRGIEAEVSYNLRGNGFSWRGFADTSRGTLSGAGNLPLQPTTRFGGEIGYREGNWRSGLKVLHAEKQNRLASFETYAAPSYTQVDANLSYTQNFKSTPVTWFAIAKNLLNEDIRLSTSVLREVAPLSGRSLIVGVRTSF